MVLTKTLWGIAGVSCVYMSGCTGEPASKANACIHQTLPVIFKPSYRGLNFFLLFMNLSVLAKVC